MVDVRHGALTDENTLLTFSIVRADIDTSAVCDITQQFRRTTALLHRRRRRPFALLLLRQHR
jgi:hypothetical protein